MTWARFDDKTWRNKKVRRLSDAAHRIWHDSITYSCDECNDGRIDEHDLEDIALSRHDQQAIAAELVAAGLWVEIESGGWQIHDFLRGNESRAQKAQKQRCKPHAREREVLGRRDGWHCRSCGTHADDLTSTIEVDHIIPRSRSGSDELSNKQLLCRSCNASKGARTMTEWTAAR